MKKEPLLNTNMRRKVRLHSMNCTEIRLKSKACLQKTEKQER